MPKAASASEAGVGNHHTQVLRVSPRVVEFYKALARKEQRLVPQLCFPDLVFDFTEEEMVQPARKYTRSTTLKAFEKVPKKVFVDEKLLPVICTIATRSSSVGMQIG